MKPFNLAEAKIAERTYCKQQLSRRLRIIVLLAILILGAVAMSYGCKVTVKGRARRLTSELADVQGRCVAIKNEISAIKAKSSQRKWQRQLAGSSKRWLGILDDLVNRVPGDLWLSRLESSESSSSVTIEGQAGSFASMSRFIGAIRSSPRFSDVRITSTRVSTPTSSAAGGGRLMGSVSVVDFALEAKLKTSEGAGALQAAPDSQAVPPVEESQ